MQLVKALLNQQRLSQADSYALFKRLVRGELNDIEMTAIVVAMAMRGETSEELAGAAQAIRSAAKMITRPNALVCDSCGTGGDGSNSFNISTTAALAAASMGLTMAKHGNRSVSSKSGSADVLEQLGIAVEVDPEQAASALAQQRFCFLFAPHYHPGIKNVMPVRQTLKARTLFNLIGPLVNPAAPDIQLLGVYHPDWCRPMAESLRLLGVKRAMVVHGSGLDELALHGPTQVVELRDGALHEYQLSAADFGLQQQPVAALKGGDARFNATITQAILAGQGNTAQTHAVAMNVAALLVMAGRAANFNEATEAAVSHLQSGEASRYLTAIQLPKVS
ncbi:anthranilate phosphoribosyltransferase [Idiomarina tyrosinivorans]|uniref:Anthranilate phosphoribosyltransferase n=1 Tax=Idiomarina tyrosinivorans TaxID=1445662 RepID=A0A432ZLH8_9GAMM|nr:anthranilate phosphoribosyltransferase [Idiomarina tyrosinivorans]RUO78841.1 anthranilate phosphoribosyltransferase [Idiomarina tyrosinivorans]